MGITKNFTLALAVVCLGAVVCLLVAFATELRNAARASRGAGTPALVVRWNQIGDWSGSGKGSTPTFTVTAGRWRFRWTARPAPNTPGGRMNVYVFRDGEHALTEVPLRRWVDGLMGDAVPVASGPGTYWLRCDCPQVEWTLGVDQSGAAAAVARSAVGVPYLQTRTGSYSLAMADATDLR